MECHLAATGRSSKSFNMVQNCVFSKEENAMELCDLMKK